MDLVLAITGPFIAFAGASIIAVLVLAMIIGTLAASVFVAIFYLTSRLGKIASRQAALPQKSGS
jgi:hypothetical protein